MRLHIFPDRDGFPADKPVVVSDSADKIGFILENRSKSGHTTRVSILGLSEGTYEITVNGKITAQKQLQKSQALAADIEIPSGAVTANVEIKLNQQK